MPFKCNDLNENKPSTGLSVLDVWAPVGGNTGEVMELFWGIVLLKKVYQWGWAFRVYSLTPLPLLYFLYDALATCCPSPPL